MSRRTLWHRWRYDLTIKRDGRVVMSANRPHLLLGMVRWHKGPRGYRWYWSRDYFDKECLPFGGCDDKLAAIEDMLGMNCRQCGAPPPTLQTYACALCGYPTPEAEANGRQPQPIDPRMRARLADAVAKRLARQPEEVEE